MELGGLAGLAGLSKNIDRTAQTNREMSTLNEVETSIEKDRQASLLAQELESKQYEEIAAKSAEMLEPDREKIRAKSLELQKTIRSKIQEYGSRKAFFENGGASLLSKYKSDLLTSSETLSYGDNKKNMESLMRLKESGKGHLISSIDIQSLNDYNQGKGDGRISYSGMKSEIDIPEKYFDYQQEIPPGNILHYKDNYMGIYSNWAMENPKLVGLKGEALEEQLLVYTMQNHSGQGLNETKYQNDMAQANLKKQQQAITKAGTEEEIPPSYVASMNEVFNDIQERNPATISNVMGQENFIIGQAKSNKALSGLLGSASPYMDVDSNYTDAGFLDGFGKGIARAVGLDKKYTPASALMVPLMDKTGVLKALYPGSPESGGVNVGINASDFYSPNGERLTNFAVKESIKKGLNNNMTFQGLIYAYTDGNGKLVTKMKNSSGEALGKKGKDGKYKMTTEEEDHMKVFSGNLKNEMFSVLVNSEGEKVYQRIGANSLKGETDLAVAIGAADNISTGLKRAQKLQVDKGMKQLQKNTNIKQIKTEVAKASSDGGAFKTPEFLMDTKLATLADGSNRNSMIKAYYLTLSALDNNGIIEANHLTKTRPYLRSNENNFTNRVNYNKELKDALLNKQNISDANYIKLFAKIHTGENQEDYEDNEIFAIQWLKILETLKIK